MKIKMKLEQCKNIFHAIANASSILQPSIQSKNEITKHVNVNVKTIVHSKKIIVGILSHVFVRISSI